MNVMEQARELMTVRRVFGEPYEKDGVTIVPVARVRGGGGEGEGSGGSQGSGRGGGFGMSASPAGAYVLKEGSVSWMPALDVNRLILGCQLVAAALILAVALSRRRR
jgi:uncharacterized spore protein YtfJ